MNRQPAAPKPAFLTCGRLVRSALLLLLIALLTPATPAAGASGSVSVSIRLEVGVADLLRGGSSAGVGGPGSSVPALAGLEPQLRRALEGRYLPSEIDRIVGEVTNNAVLVVDGEPVGQSAAGAVVFETGTGYVYSL